MSSSSAEEQMGNKPARARRMLRLLIRLVAIAVVSASLLGHLERHGLLFELLAHFRWQYAALLVAGSIALLALRSPKAGVVVGVVAVTDLLTIAPYLVPSAPAPAPRASSPLRVLSQNVNTGNTRSADVLALIDREQPDVVLLLEVSPRWMEQLRPLDEVYPFSCSSPRTDNFGIAVWSRFELADTQIEPMTEARVPVIITDVVAPGGRIRLIGAHPLPPVSGAYLALRNEQIELLAQRVRERADVPTIIAGDLNATPWSRALRGLFRDAGLRDSAQGFGLQCTWPSSLWPMRIPIDHVLVSEGIAVVDRRISGDVGSDHFGVIADLHIDARQ